MPDLPTPQDAAEAALFSECWDAVLSYADLCTSGSAAATQLATEAFTHGIDEARSATARTKTTGRRNPRLPRIPLLLNAVRTTAAAWEAHGQGYRLDPDLRLWLNSEKAARYTGPPLHRPVALRGLRDLQEPDAALLWLVEVEALPLPAVARRLGLDPVAAAEELGQVRTLFRDRCHRNHLDTPMDADCRSYARLLDAVTRSPGAETPEDLSRHLARCVECAEAAACLRLHGGGLPAALAGGVIGWGGLAYLERRRRAAEAGLAGGRTDAAADTGLAVVKEAAPRIGRTGLLVAAVIVSGLALTVSLMPFGAKNDGAVSASGDAADGRPVADPGVSSPPATKRAEGSLVSPEPVGLSAGTGAKSGPEPRGTASSPDRATRAATPGSKTSPKPSGSPQGPASCTVKYDVVDQWADGFQVNVTVTSAEALDSWQVGWTFADGQRITQMWDGVLSQSGSRVTASAEQYNGSVAAGGSFTFGFLGSWHDGNASPATFTLDGGRCANAH
ncbi:cellulose binding domain-containing protein [Streptomyces sp. NPDC059618]|uniref:cellulose binding domain-containing protein n=1 Tax=Streptomyces sp. NPDC059618 TaxID=3346887 RepID=UPI0036BACB7B